MNKKAGHSQLHLKIEYLTLFVKWLDHLFLLLIQGLEHVVAHDLDNFRGARFEFHKAIFVDVCR